MKVETLVTLESLGEKVDVKEWSNFLGLSPLAYCIKGERVSNSPFAIVSENSFWTYGILRSKENKVEDQLERIIHQLYMRKHEILSLVKTFHLEIGCSTFVWPDNKSNLSIQFSKELINRIFELGLEFALTYY